MRTCVRNVTFIRVRVQLTGTVEAKARLKEPQAWLNVAVVLLLVYCYFLSLSLTNQL